MRKKMHFSDRASAFSTRVLLCILAILISGPALYGQAKGTITGRVTDAESGDFLPGANVMLAGTQFGAATDRYGAYRIENVPPGNYTLVISYMGYLKFQTEITVLAGRVAQNATLEKEVLKGQTVMVTGLRQGQVRALSQQRTADNIKNVVDEEEMQRFPDVNSAEVLQRVPGVSVTRDQGEGRYVLVRGTSPFLNSMTINGEKIPSPEGGVRTVALDVISADQLESIEVTKAITPDMDGNAIGGAVELKTKTALDYPGRVLNATLGTGYNNLMGKGIYQGNLTYGDRFGRAQNIGFMVSGSYHRHNRGSHNNEMEWGGEETQDGTDIPFALRDIETRLYSIQRNRMTVTGTLDYLPSVGHKIYVSSIYSHYEDSETRRALRMRPAKGDYNSATDISEAAVEAELNDRDQNMYVSNIMAGGEHQFSKLKLDYRLSYSYAQEKEPRYLSSSFELDEDPDLILNLSDTDNPTWSTNLGPGYEYDPAHFVLDGLEVDDTKTTDRDIVGGFNMEMPYSIGINQATLKVGAKVLMKTKDRKEIISEWEWDGDDDILMSRFADTMTEDNFLDGKYPKPTAPDPKNLYDWFHANKGSMDSGDLQGEINKEDSDGATYDATEDVYAYYAMTTMNFGKVMVLGGFRHEFTKINYTGNEVIFDEEGDYEQTLTRTNENDYNHILPMVHLRFRPNPNTNLRAALTTGIARPNYEDLVPYRIVAREDEEIEMGNPELLPTTSMNFDLMGEHFFQGVGILAGGVFYKKMQDIIFPSYYQIGSGEYEKYYVLQAIQGEDASLFGLEVNWQQQLRFLPGFFSGLGVMANYTYTTSSAKVSGRDDVTIPGQASNIANFALSYEKGGFSGRLGMNYHGKYLEELGENADQDIYYDNHMQWDISAAQTIAGGIQVYLQAVNMGNAPLRYYMGTSSRPVQREYYSWWLQGGIRYSF
ncbi:TonB-dependent receptor [candidate division KSB1 bacterium]|nr:TonB-dependent receptor [candidate division KSB1 bacterium]